MAREPLNREHKRRIGLVIVVTQLVLALVTGTTVYAFYSTIDGNIKSSKPIPHQVAAGPKGPLNILVMGTDSRSCTGCGIDSEAGSGGSDTTILVHVSADRKTVYGISIPRDALVRPVPCTKDHRYVNPQGVATSYVEWNEAFAAGGPACTAEQLEGNFGVYVNDYVVVNFAGFKNMVDAVNGVDVCIPEELYDPHYQPHDFEPGKHVHLDGDIALQYVRLRHASNLDGSDTGRIKRQQYFVSRLIDKVFSAKTLSNPVSLYKFANAFTDSIETNPALANAKALVELAEQLRHVSLSHIRFVTLPSTDYPDDSIEYYRVKVLPKKTAALMKRVRADEPLGRFGKGAQRAGGHHRTSAEVKAQDLQYGLCS